MTAAGQTEVTTKVTDLRLALLDEEYTEFLEALNWGDPIHIAKEACDLVYVVVGTLVSMGIPFNEVFSALQVSNLSKIGPDGSVVRREDNKILKGPNFVPAENLIKEILG